MSPTESGGESQASLAVGTRLGPYEILGSIGKGGMGEVYRASDSRLGRQVAIKVISARFSQRFEHEARAVAALNHPNICQIYDVGPNYLVMELVEGPTLAERLKRGKTPVEEALRIIRQVQDALEAAHEKRIVHRDLKPANIKLTPKNVVKVLDFGLAKSVAGHDGEGVTLTAGLTEPGLVMGTPGYMSPEQARGEEVDRRTDIWAHGCVLYELLTGYRAFAGRGIAEQMASVLMQEPDWNLLPVETPSKLHKLLKRCLTKDRDQRYQDIGDVRRELEDDVGVNSIWEYQGEAQRVCAKAITALAVLPFANAGADPETDYLSEGITETIINNLSQLSELRVVPRNSAFRYKGREVDYAMIRGELAVRAVVTGRVMQRGENLIISAELVDIANDCQLWGERYNRRLSEIFAVQEEIATQISEKLKLKLTGHDKERLLRRYTENRQAYQLYLRGRYQWSRRTPKSLKLAVECFQQAIHEDPLYALAYAGLADGYILLGWYGLFRPDESLECSKGAAVKAVEIDPELAEGQAALGFAKACDRDFSGAEVAFDNAIRINPTYWLSYDWRALCLSGMGRSDEAVAAVRRAQQLDPLSLVIHHHAAWVYIHARRYDEAVEQCHRAMELDPNYPFAHLWLGLAYTETARHAEALTALKTAAETLRDVPFAIAFLGHAYARAGQKSNAADLLDRLARSDTQFYIDPYHLSLIHAGLGQFDLAFHCLEKSYRDRSMWLTAWAALDPRLDGLRSDRRFSHILNRIGVPG